MGASALRFFVLSVLAGLPLALSHDIGGPIAWVALAPLFWLALHGERVFWLGAVAGFVEVFIAMWGCSSYGYLIPFILALQGAFRSSPASRRSRAPKFFAPAIKPQTKQKGMKILGVFMR